MILSQPRLADLLFRQSISLQSSSWWVFTARGVCLLQELRAGQGSASNGMVESLWLWFGGRRSSKRSLCFGRARGVRKESDFLRDATAEVGEGLANVWRVIVSLILVLVCDCKQLLVDLFQRIDALLEFNIVRRKLSLILY